jgi:hypothetical protein
MDAEAGVPPAEDLPDEGLVNAPLPLEHFQNPVAKELLQVSQVQPG